MTKLKTVGLNYGALRKECLAAVRQWPGCETIGGIQIIRTNTRPGGLSVRVTLYGNADERLADRAMTCVEREKRRTLSGFSRSALRIFSRSFSMIKLQPP
jgi:hypothetical protein